MVLVFKGSLVKENEELYEAWRERTNQYIDALRCNLELQVLLCKYIRLGSVEYLADLVSKDQQK